MLKSVAMHLIERSILFAYILLGIKIGSHFSQSSFEFFKGNFAVIISIEFFHEHLDLFFKSWVSESFVKEFFNFIRSYESGIVFINSFESLFEFLVGVYVDTY